MPQSAPRNAAANDLFSRIRFGEKQTLAVPERKALFTIIDPYFVRMFGVEASPFRTSSASPAANQPILVYACVSGAP